MSPVLRGARWWILLVLGSGLWGVPQALWAQQTTPAPAPAGQTVRLLTIGNSFSQNATKFLKEIAQADGQTLIQ